MKETLNGLKISKENWVRQGVFSYSEMPNRKASDVVIGIKRYGDIRNKVTEPFYLDILEMVFNKKVKVYVDLYAEPSVVVELNGKLVLHNGDIASLKEDVEMLLDQVVDSNQIRALTEIRSNLYRESKIGPTTKAIRNIISQNFNRKINFHLLRLILIEKYINKVAPATSDLEHKMKAYENKQLIEIYGGIMEYEKTKGCKFGPIQELLLDYTPADIQRAMWKEVSKRFYLGDIK